MYGQVHSILVSVCGPLFHWGLTLTYVCLVETGEPIGSLEWKEDVIQETGADFLLMAVRSCRIFRVTDV